jgi:hypothetical protein
MDNRPAGLTLPNAATTDRETDERAGELRSDIERTRGDISETVEAIQEKLRPGNVVASAASATTEKVRDMAYNASDAAQDWWDGSSGQRVTMRVRRNPLAAVLAGVGLAWLAFGGDGRRYDYRERPPRRRLPEAEPMYDYRERPPRRRLREAEPMIRRGGRRLEMTLHDYPLAVGIAAAILGASVGMVVPATEGENELMGETRDRAVQRAKDSASGAVDRAKDAAADVVTRTAMGQ